MHRYLPNIITSLRIVGALVLWALAPDGVAFWALYALCGVSDMVDGYAARKLNAESSLGAILDSVADIVMVAVCAWKLIPLLCIPSWIWWWCAGIALIKVINVISSLVVFKKVLFPHTIANKITGASLFVVVPLIYFCGWYLLAVVVAVIATFAAVEEGHLIRTKRI